MNLAVAATAPLGADVLERLAAKHEIEFLLTRPDRQRGRGRKVGAPPAKEAALRLGIPVRQVERLDETFPLDGADTIVVVAYGALIPSSLLDRANWLNVHPSRLPRWRGAAPIERAIMAGDEESAVSVIRLVEELDAGPIGAWHDLSIGGDTTAGDVYAEVARLAPELIDEALANDSFSPQVGEPTYAEKIGPADRELDWSRPAKELHDRIRALSPHIGARGELEGRQRDRLARPARRRPPRVARGAAGRRDPHVLRRVAPRLTLLTMGWTDWVRGLEIEPSIYAADFSRLGEQLETVMSAGARIFQFDVGDGQFVEPITIGPIVLKSISPLVHELGGVLDCHLMIVSPEKHFEAIAEAGGDSVTVHYEVCDDLPGVIAQARELGLGVGVAFNPETEPDAVAEAAGGLVDLVLCMSIHPGYSGQPFMPESIPRVRRLRELLPDDVYIQVDGGVGPANVRELREAGASLLVAGTSVFGQKDIAAAYRELAAL